MTDLLLYSNPMSRGRIARWMLEETGQPYQVHVLDYGEPMKSPTFKALNPMGKVPTLVHGDAVVTETAAICAYLAETFPEAELAPQTSNERAAYFRWLFFRMGLWRLLSQSCFRCEPPKEKAVSVGYGTYEDVMDTLEIAVSTGPYIAGDRFTAADVYVGSHVAWGLQFGSIDKRAAFIAYWNRLKDRPAHVRATEMDDAAMPKKA